ncbi:MAG: nucleotidyltransferase family protein [Gammaproteobacteria bacterium]|nr:nucleotidyltransferase family protein [Gammaproteobacteria bacterium]MYC58650.1 nucleotidyltransferase family protein [Gammaproteobacteria bacterium]MYE28933.1 nucleotidyltransferase family protein [Gammaproteobacteria bacterium]
MQAILLAAGRGERMRPITDTTPKPLLKVGEHTLIEHQLMRLARAGIKRVAVNLFHLGGMIRDTLGDGSRFGLEIAYSPEAELLDTAGGIIQAMSLVEGESFIVANSDVWTGFDYSALGPVDSGETLAHLVLVPNPPARPNGDFFLDGEGRVHDRIDAPAARCTFAGISVMHRNLFAGLKPEPLSVVPLLCAAMNRGQVGGELYRGEWMDIGTPERLQELNARQ